MRLCLKCYKSIVLVGGGHLQSALVRLLYLLVLVVLAFGAIKPDSILLYYNNSPLTPKCRDVLL